MIRWIAFDADDTLWENEIYYQRVQEALCQILKAYCPAEKVAAALLQTEIRNIPAFGYGIKSFGLSMIETAINLSGGAISASEILVILERLKWMVNNPPALLEGVNEALSALLGNYQMMVITKGDLMDQERKMASSGLAAYFEIFEVVHTKDQSTYQKLLAKHKIEANEFVMVGNSLRSDVLPVVALGAAGVWIPHALTWEHEKMVDSEPDNQQFYELATIRALPTLVAEIAHGYA